MGDRANLVIKFTAVPEGAKLGTVLESGAITLYSHWGGHDLGPDLSRALRAAQPRWTDDGYCARILVSRMVGGSHESETGYGLYLNQIADNERPILVVDIEKQAVIRFGDGYVSPRDADEQVETGRWTFDEFCVMDSAEARKAHLGRD